MTSLEINVLFCIQVHFVPLVAAGFRKSMFSRAGDYPAILNLQLKN